MEDEIKCKAGMPIVVGVMKGLNHECTKQLGHEGQHYCGWQNCDGKNICGKEWS